jgi:exonuclease SbcC
MIPLRLQIKNFLSYGSELQTIDFNHYQLICLSGKNGHGKSALLDALTWAIWGQARKISGTAKADQGLLRLGQTNMLVALDFTCNGQTYRVRREYSYLYGKPHASVDFGVLEPDTDKYISLTDKTIRETQAKIENTIKLDYDSFINSAFLRQGQSNEFSKKTPKERKEILANILGLTTYETIRKKAQDKARALILQKNALEFTIEKKNKELETLSQVQLEKNAIETALTTIIDTLEREKANKVSLEQEKTRTNAKKQEYEQKIYQLSVLEDEFEKKKSNWLSTITEWRSIHRRRKNIKHLETVMAEKKSVVTELNKFQALNEKRLTLREELLLVKTAYQRRELELNLAHSTIKEQAKHHIEQYNAEINNLENKLKELNEHNTRLSAEQNAAQKQLQILVVQESTQAHNTFKSIEQQFEKRKEFYHKWITLGNIIKTQLETAKQKLILSDNEAPSCPLCEQNLSASRKRFLHHKLTAEIQRIKHQLNRLIKITKKLKEILYSQHAEYETIKKEKQNAAVASAQKEHIIKQIEQIESQLGVNKKISTELNIKKIEILSLLTAAQLKKKEVDNTDPKNNDAEFQRLSKQLEIKQQELNTLEYSEQKHAELKQYAYVLDNTIQELHETQTQLLAQQDRLKRIYSLSGELRVLKSTINSHKQELPDHDIVAKDEFDISQKLLKNDQLLQLLNSQKEELLIKKAGIDHTLKRFDAIQAELIQINTEMNAILATHNDYLAIAQATSKDGVQALLIEEVLPEIESEANLLLSRLTDNQTQLFIESLRDLKKGGSRETLDIKISDASGLRPYELFSGGEAFRIDFALRIAISKLLARRSGTALQTLIIDEGFGSQDDDGLQHIMDVLYAIQQDFAKIIIVSHLPAMKNQFPVHFSIEKNSRGSYVQIIEQD